MAAAILMLGALAGYVSAQSCSSVTPIPGGTTSLGIGNANAFTAWDNDTNAGPAPNLMVMGGDFVSCESSGGQLTNLGGLVGWDGSDFVRIGAESDPNRPHGRVTHLVSLDPDGAGTRSVWLFAVCENPCELHWFDGNTWNMLSMRGHVSAVTTFDPDGNFGSLPRQLVLGGEDLNPSNFVNGFPIAFFNVFGIGTNGIFGNGIDGFGLRSTTPHPGEDTIQALTSWDPDGPGPLSEQLVVGGRFDRDGPGSTTLGNIVIYKPTTANSHVIDRVGGGVNGPVTALTTFASGSLPTLVIGGEFSFNLAGGGTTTGLIIWNGTQFEAFGGQHTGVTAFATWDPDGALPGGRRLVANGRHGASFHGVSVYSGSPNNIDGGFDNLAPDLVHGFFGNILEPIPALGVWDVAGNLAQPNFLFAGGPRGVVQIGQNSKWIGVPQVAPTGPIAAISSGLNTGLTLAGPGSRTFFGGQFDQLGSVPARNIGAWSGTQWRPVGTGLNGPVSCMLRGRISTSPFANDIFVVGGSFTATGSGATALNNIAQLSTDFQGFDTWLPLGSGLNGAVSAMTIFDPDGSGPLGRHIVAGGSFTTAGGATANRIALWSPSAQAWSTLGSGFNGPVYALAVFDPDGPTGPLSPRLYAGGQFSVAGGRTISNLAMWDGLQWLAADCGAPNGPVYALSAWSRPGYFRPFALIIGGSFSTMAGNTSDNVAVWNGVSREPFDAGVNGAVRAITFADMTQRANFGNTTTEPIIGGEFTAIMRGAAAEQPTPEHLAMLISNEQRWVPVARTGSNVVNPVVAGQGVFALAPRVVPIGDGRSIFVGGNLPSTNRNTDHLYVFTSRMPFLTAHTDFPAEPQCVGSTQIASITVAGDSFVYRWTRNGVSLFNGPTPSGSVLSGVDTATLTITNAQVADSGSYDCIVENLCERVDYFPPTSLSVRVCCTVDFNTDGSVNADDLGDFITCFFTGAACTGSDFNHDGSVDADDLGDFITSFFAGCP